MTPLISPSHHRFARLMLAAWVFTAAACDSPTGPIELVRISAHVIEGPTVTTYLNGDGHPEIDCGVSLELRATGLGGARWTRMGVRWYPGTQRLAPIDSTFWQYADSWFVPEPIIRSGQSDTVRIHQVLSGATGRDFMYYYRAAGDSRERSVEYHLDCGPIAPEGSAPPVVTILEVRGSDAVIEYGDTLIVRYRVAGGAPLFRTRVVVNGGFGVDRDYAENFDTLAIRELRFVVPRSAVLDRPISLWITTHDVAERYGTVADTTALSVVDVRAPQVDSVALTRGQYMTGAELTFVVHASEERLLSHIVWEFDGTIGGRDSIATQETVQPITIHAKPEWAGKQGRLRVFARDAGGNYSTVWQSAPNAFAFYPNLTMTGTGFGLLETANDVVYDRQRERLYAVNTYGQHVVVFDIATMTTLATIPLPPWPGAADISLSGDSLLVTQSELRAVSVVDLNALALVDTIPLPVVDSVAAAEGPNPPLPTGIRVMANGKAIIQLHREAAGGFNTVELDLQTGASRLRTETVGGGGGGTENWWSRMGVSPDRELLVLLDVGCTRTYRANLDAFSSCLAPDPGDLQATHFGFDASSSRVSVGGRVLTSALAPVATLALGASQLTPDGLYALGVSGEGLLKIRIADGLIMGRIFLGGEPPRLILLDDGVTMLMLGGVAVQKFDTTPLP